VVQNLQLHGMHTGPPGVEIVAVPTAHVLQPLVLFNTAPTVSHRYRLAHLPPGAGTRVARSPAHSNHQPAACNSQPAVTRTGTRPPCRPTDEQMAKTLHPNPPSPNSTTSICRLRKVTENLHCLHMRLIGALKLLLTYNILTCHDVVDFQRENKGVALSTTW